MPPGDPQAAAAALDRLCAIRRLPTRLGAGALAHAADLTWDRRAEKIAAFLEARLSAAIAAASRRPSAL